MKDKLIQMKIRGKKKIYVAKQKERGYVYKEGEKEKRRKRGSSKIKRTSMSN